VAAPRKCSECPTPLTYPDGTHKPPITRTCSKRCRAKRARRIKRATAEGRAKSPYALELQELATAAQDSAKDVAHELLKDELRPIIREAMTEEVLRGIQTMVEITPEAIAVLKEQLTSKDATIAQRAATLMLKYTMGNPSVAPPPTQAAPSPLTVQFNIPRPGDAIAASSEVSTEATLRECTDCSTHKPEDDFVGASPRCQECFDKLHATLEQRFAKDDTTKPEEAK
jgi:hypothetical protein